MRIVDGISKSNCSEMMMDRERGRNGK